jgi:uncharacterized protein
MDSAGRKQGYWKNYKDEYGKSYLYEEGAYINNRKEGLWTQYYSGGKLKNKIEYKDGKINGKTIMYHANGNIDENGTWKYNRWVGPYEKYYESGKIFCKLNWNDNGKRHGKQIWYNESGAIDCETDYTDGKCESGKTCYPSGDYSVPNRRRPREAMVYYNKDGKITSENYDTLKITYYDNGNRKAYLPYKNGKLDGEAIYYYQSEEVKEKITYKEGYQHGPFTLYYESGAPAYKGEYKFGKMSGQRTCLDHDGKLFNGMFVMYDEKGNKIREVFCNNGKPEGELKCYNEKGEVIMIVNFKDGKPHGLRYYLHNGKKIAIEKYNEGEFTGYGWEQ